MAVRHRELPQEIDTPCDCVRRCCAECVGTKMADRTTCACSRSGCAACAGVPLLPGVMPAANRLVLYLPSMVLPHCAGAKRAFVAFLERCSLKALNGTACARGYTPLAVLASWWSENEQRSAECQRTLLELGVVLIAAGADPKVEFSCRPLFIEDTTAEQVAVATGNTPFVQLFRCYAHWAGSERSVWTTAVVALATAAALLQAAGWTKRLRPRNNAPLSPSPLLACVLADAVRVVILPTADCVPADRKYSHAMVSEYAGMVAAFL